MTILPNHRTVHFRIAGLLAGAVVAILGLAAAAVPCASAQSVEAQHSTVVNGIDTAQLDAVIQHLQEDEDVGRVTFFSRSRWQDGMRAFTTFTGYEVDGEVRHKNTREFTLLGDEATEIGGTDTAPGAVEELMYALGTCIIAAGNANAALRGIELTRFEVDLESDLDLHGLFAVDPGVRPGILELRSTITIAGDAGDEALREIAMLGFEYSPVSESLRNGVRVIPEVVVVQ